VVLLVFQLSSCGSDEPPRQATKGADSSAKPNEAVEPASPSTVPQVRAPAAPPQADKLPEPISPAAEKASGVNIRAIEFSPAIPVAGDAISARVQFDREFSTPPVLHFQWKINGGVVQESLEATMNQPTKRGDTVEVTVFPEELRDPARAVVGFIKVGGSPPIISKTREAMDEQGGYTAWFETSHPDGDPVTVTLQKGPTGMAIDTAKRELHWSIPAGTQGTFPVELLATDPTGGKAICSFSITIRQEQPKASESNAPSKSQ
jgi:hypothetical protein